MENKTGSSGTFRYHIQFFQEPQGDASQLKEIKIIDYTSEEISLGPGKYNDFSFSVGQTGGKYQEGFGEPGMELGHWGKRLSYRWQIRACDDSGCSQWALSGDPAFTLPEYFSALEDSGNYLLVGAVTQISAEMVAHSPYELEARVLYGVPYYDHPPVKFRHRLASYVGLGCMWRNVASDGNTQIWRFRLKAKESPLFLMEFNPGFLKDSRDDQNFMNSAAYLSVDHLNTLKNDKRLHIFFYDTRVKSQYIYIKTKKNDDPNDHAWVLFKGDTSFPQNSTKPGTFRFKLSNLFPDTIYNYFLIFKRKGVEEEWQHDNLKTFSTAKTEGKSFKAAITADLHSPAKQPLFMNWIKQLLPCIKADHPDFVVDMGDLVDLDLVRVGSDRSQADNFYLNEISIFQELGLPTVFVPGNHEAINQYYNKELSAFWGLHYTPWLSELPLISGTARIDHMVNFNHGLNDLFPDYKTFFSWEWGDVCFVVFDPYTYTTSYPNHCVDDCTYTLGERQKKWIRQVVLNTKKKYLLLLGHHTLSGIYTNGVLCYGKGGGAVIERGNNLEEIFEPLLLCKARPLVLLGHDHVFVGEKYKDIPIVHCPSWTKSRIDNWSWDNEGYKYSKFLFDGCFVPGKGEGTDTIWISTIDSIAEAKDRLILKYAQSANDTSLPHPEKEKGQFPKVLRNASKRDNATILNVDLEKKTIEVAKQENMAGAHEWAVGDSIMFICGMPGYIVIEAGPERLIYYMKDKNGKEVKGTRGSIMPKG